MRGLAIIRPHAQLHLSLKDIFIVVLLQRVGVLKKRIAAQN